MKIEVYLYSSRGNVEEKQLDDINPPKLGSKEMLWINILERRDEPITKVASVLKMENVPLESLLNVQERPKIDHFDDYFRFFIVSVGMNGKGEPKRIPIDFLVGKNYVVTIHDGEVGYFEEFRQLEKGATQIGAMNSESFVATLLNMHIVSYFRALESLELRVDDLDDKILKTDLEDREFLTEVVHLRGCFARLRRWFLPHRDVFYALSRPDFQTIADNESVRQFEQLNEHFENAVDMIESSRDTVLSLFDLYATKSAQTTNLFIQRLTFLTLLVGSLSVIAGILGMNYQVGIFESEAGFWITIAGMALIALTLTIYARFKRWI